MKAETVEFAKSTLGKMLETMDEQNAVHVLTLMRKACGSLSTSIRLTMQVEHLADPTKMAGDLEGMDEDDFDEMRWEMTGDDSTMGTGFPLLPGAHRARRMTANGTGMTGGMDDGFIAGRFIEEIMGSLQGLLGAQTANGLLLAGIRAHEAGLPDLGAQLITQSGLQHPGIEGPTTEDEGPNIEVVPDAAPDGLTAEETHQPPIVLSEHRDKGATKPPGLEA